MQVIEAIMWGLLWVFPITCVLGLLFGGFGGYFWGTWGVAAGLATAMVLGSILEPVSKVLES